MKNNKQIINTGICVLASLISTVCGAATSTTPVVDESNSLKDPLGLYQPNQFKLSHGACAHCAITPQASWYFTQETIAVPLSNSNSFDPVLSAQDDVKQWYGQPKQTPVMPALIWLGSPQTIQGKISADGKILENQNGNTPLAITPKIESNRSYFNEQSQQYFANRDVAIRGTAEKTHFTARTIWPLDYNLDLSQLPYQPLNDKETITSLIRSNNGGAGQPFSARVLYKKSDLTSLQNKPVLSFVLNGAQGDDDEAHGGHFAIATGRFGEQGEWNNWLVNNFYNLGSVSEKGIIAATLPMDSYQGDFNSGQSWYRPSYMLVAVLKDERSAATYQSAINRVMQHFYRQDFKYRHAGVNCAGINLETLRSLDWHIPKLGATNLPKAFLALPFKAISDMSLESGLKAYDYLSAEQTNLYPFVAFDTIGNDLLNRIAKNQTNSAFEKQLAEDLEAIIYVHIPQFPSSRAMGQAPVASLDEYIARTPADMSQWKIIPVGPREFPKELKDKNAPGEPLRPAYYGLIAWLAILAATVLGLRRLFNNKTKKNQ